MSRRSRPRPTTKRQEGEDLDLQAQVRLKTLLGMKPGTYLTVLYALAVLLVLFLLLFYKGLRDQGTYLRVVSYPGRAAVTVDGRYAGSTPCVILIPRGTHVVATSKPFFSPAVLEDRFAGPVFATLFVRPERDWTVNLVTTQPKELVASALRDLADSPHISQPLRDTAVAAAGNLSAASDIYSFADYSKYFISNSSLAADYVYALFASLSNGEVLSGAALMRIVQYIVQLKEKYENAPLLLALAVPEEAARELAGNSWYGSFAAGYRDYLATAQRAAVSVGAGTGALATASVHGLSFAGVPGGTLQQGLGPDGAQGTLVPHPVAVQEFYISRTEVSNRVYKRFVDENPSWAKANLEALLRAGQVNDAYLSAWQGDSYAPGEGELPVTGVSYFAAEAFCDWVGRSLPFPLAGYQARLPLESEWEWAARGGLVGKNYPRGNQPDGDVFFEPGITGPRPAGSSPGNGYGLQDMSGNVWEWCLDWYSATKYVFTARSAAGNSPDSRTEIPHGAQKVIRGGGWANEKELVKVYVRGSQPPQWCTPYLGFRVVLAKASQ